MKINSIVESRDMCSVCGQTPCNCTYITEDAEPIDREWALVKKLGRLGERIAQNPRLWERYTEAVDSGDTDWIISLIQEGTGADKTEVMKLADLFGEIGGGLGRLVDFAWAVKEGTWAEDFVTPYRHHRAQEMEEGIEGEIAGGVVGSVVGGAAGSTLGPIGGAIGSTLGGSVGSAIGSRYQDGKPLKEKQQLDEIAPLLAVGARLFMAAAPKIAQVIGKTGRAGAEITAKNADKIGLGAGAYEIGSSVADIAKDITAKVGQAVNEKTVVELATLAFKYAIPAGIVLAILYGGKKAIDSLFSDDKQKPGVAEGQELYGLRTGDTVRAEVNGQTVQGDVIDIFPDTMEVELLLRGPNSGQTVTVDVRDTEALNEQGVAEMDKSQPSHGRDGKISHSTYGSRDRGGSTGQERTAKATTADKMMKHAHDVMMKSMSDADKVKKGWRNPDMKEQGVAEGKRQEKEADYGPDYQDMVARVKKLAGLGPLKTVWDPQKRVYKNVPRAEQPKK